MTATGKPPTVDPVQLDRIEAMHGGFLFQHLYAVRALLLAPGSDVLSIVVEGDEDVELVRNDLRTYVQIKKRANAISNSDVDDALRRFATYRGLHGSGERSGRCNFVIATNAPPTASLAARIAADDWSRDVRLDWPNAARDGGGVDSTLPARDLASAFLQCATLAAGLPFSLLAPETLVWKLAGAVMAASAGASPRIDHRFDVDELPALFEQLVVQLQDFPSPPPLYRAQLEEPGLATPDAVRLIVGWSGAGKTAWVAQTGMHALSDAVYLDVRDTPGPTLMSAVARDAAARLYGSGGRLGQVLLSGASGREVLLALDRKLSGEGRSALVVLDNVHAVPPEDTAKTVSGLSSLRFVLLAHPGPAASELATRLGLQSEELKGWSADTVASVAVDEGCSADPAACNQLLAVTGGLPLYVINSMKLAAAEYAGDVGAMCRDIASRTHTVLTAQELILGRLLGKLSTDARRTLSLLSYCDVPLPRGELADAIERAFGRNARSSTADFRQLRALGVLEIFGVDRVKVHDAVRLAGLAELDALGEDNRAALFRGLRQVLEASVSAEWAYAKVKLLLRVIGETGDAKTLVQLGGDEIFHEMGFWPEIADRLTILADDPGQSPETRFWALDGLVFASIRTASPDTIARLATMRSLAEVHDLDDDARLALGMKEMMAFSTLRMRVEALQAMKVTKAALPPHAVHARIFRYNAAATLFQMGEAKEAADEALALTQEYYKLLGVTPIDVIGSNADALRAKVRDFGSLTDNCKHLADCLDLLAMATNACGSDAVFARVHAMKFYQLAQAPESLVRVGQDLVDEFIGRRDFQGALQVFEDSVLPIVRDLKLAAYVIPVRSQYAVVLAYCRRFKEAEAEMARLTAYEPALPDVAREGMANQRALIASLRRHGPPMQWFENEAFSRPNAGSRHATDKVGRNQPCPCRSGLKFKKCCGQ